MFKKGLLLVLLSILASVLLAQEEKKQQESWAAVAVGTGGSLGGKMMNFDFRITRYATDDEVKRLAELLKEKGVDALRKELEKMDSGRINPVGSTGNQIAIARKKQVGSETVITMITARSMSFLELYRSGRSTDYPFGLLKVTLNDKGEGTGQIMGAALLRFNKKKGQYEIESYGNQYVKVTNVRPWK